MFFGCCEPVLSEPHDWQSCGCCCSVDPLEHSESLQSEMTHWVECLHHSSVLPQRLEWRNPPAACVWQPCHSCSLMAAHGGSQDCPCTCSHWCSVRGYCTCAPQHWWWFHEGCHHLCAFPPSAQLIRWHNDQCQHTLRTSRTRSFFTASDMAPIMTWSFLTLCAFCLSIASSSAFFLSKALPKFFKTWLRSCRLMSGRAPTSLSAYNKSMYSGKRIHLHTLSAAIVLESQSPMISEAWMP